VTLGHRTAGRMAAVVLNAGEQTLLGQDFLSKFESVEIKGDKMLLR
jgi:predicted aspartyl protease